MAHFTASLVFKLRNIKYYHIKNDANKNDAQVYNLYHPLLNLPSQRYYIIEMLIDFFNLLDLSMLYFSRITNIGLNLT